MLKNFLALLLTVGVCATACKDPKKDIEAELVAEVMKVHDNCMPKLADINALKRQVQSYKAALPEDDPLRPKFVETYMALSKAEDGMMDWMMHWGDYRSAQHTHEELMQFYQNQRKVIQGVSDSIFMSIAQAKGLLATVPNGSNNSNGSKNQ